MCKDNISVLITKLNKGEKVYNELWEHVSSLVYSIAFKYSQRHGYEYDDVKQNAFIAWHNLTRTFNLDKMKSDNIEANYIGYLNKYLERRLHDYSSSYSIFKDNSKDIVSYSDYDDIGFLSEDMQVEPFDDYYIQALSIEEHYHKFSGREKQVFNLLKEGYDDGYIANKLDISYQNVYEYRKRIFKKIQ